MRIRAALFGLGKMGLSHQAIINTHPDIDLVAICDTTEYLIDALGKYTSVKTYTDFRKLLADEKLDAVFIATPSTFHANMTRAALEADLHVFCEKPFCLDVEEGMRLVDLAERKKRVNQVGYHYRFVSTFQEMKRLLNLNAIGKLHHIRAEAYGPVVLRPTGATWRSNRSEGGGCLYDYATHAIDLVNYLVGRPDAVGGTIMNRLFSRDVADEVHANLMYSSGLSGQIAANWSDESHRKMSLKVTAWGANGKVEGDRQELLVYIRDDTGLPEELSKGWNTRYTTDLTEPVWFYLRGEEYSAQIDHFVQAIKAGHLDTRSTFRSAVDTDLVTSAIVKDADAERTMTSPEKVIPVAGQRKARFWNALSRPKSSTRSTSA